MSPQPVVSSGPILWPSILNLGLCVFIYVRVDVGVGGVIGRGIISDYCCVGELAAHCHWGWVWGAQGLVADMIQRSKVEEQDSNGRIG